MSVIVKNLNIIVLTKNVIVSVVIVAEVMVANKNHNNQRREKIQVNQRLGCKNSLYTKYIIGYLNNSLHTN